jgi:molybdopterin molybdotransferase
MNPGCDESIIRDANQHGTRRLHALRELLDAIDRSAHAIGTEQVGVEESLGRRLGADLVASEDYPGSVRSKMDGFALRGAETIGASTYHPLLFSVVDESVHTPAQALGEVAGYAVPVGIGSDLPGFADAVIPSAEVDAQRSGLITIAVPVAPGQNVQPIAGEACAGTVLRSAGGRVNLYTVAAAQVLGIAEITIVRRPRTRVVVVGSELLSIDGPAAARAVREATSRALSAAVSRDGGIVESVSIIADDPVAISTRLSVDGADLILVAGGTGWGPDDQVVAVLSGMRGLMMHGVALRQAPTAGLGRIRDALVILLPGSPAACLAAYDVLAARAIRRFTGENGVWPSRREGVLTRKISSRLGYVDYVPVRWVDETVLEPLAAGNLMKSVAADGFILIPESEEGFPAGARVLVHCYHAG